MPKPSNQPAFLDTARAFYGEAFEPRKKRDLARSIEEWTEMEEDEQSFVVAHLLYLNLKAQAAGQRLLADVRDLLDEVADGLLTAMEEDDEPNVMPDEAFVADDDDQEPDGFPVDGGDEPASDDPAEDEAAETTEDDNADLPSAA